MRLTLAALSAAALVACSPADAPPPEATVAETPASVLEVTDAYVMKPSGARDIAGGGLTLSVTGAPMWLTGASTDIADTVELHTMSMEDGVMRMRKVDQLEVSEDAPLVLESGGAHLMLFGVRSDIAAGDTSDIVLTLMDAEGNEQTLVTEAEIREFGQ